MTGREAMRLNGRKIALYAQRLSPCETDASHAIGALLTAVVMYCEPQPDPRSALEVAIGALQRALAAMEERTC